MHQASQTYTIHIVWLVSQDTTRGTVLFFKKDNVIE